MSTNATKATHSAKARRDWKPGFLQALAEHGTVTAACTAVDINRTTAYRARQHDEDFALEWSDIESTVTEQLEAKALELALNGDTRMLEFLLKARRPTTYREQKFQVEHSGKVGTDLSSLSVEQLNELVAGLGERRASAA